MVETTAKQIGIRITGQIDLPSRQATYLPPPTELDLDVQKLLVQKYPKGLYSHQAEAITAVLNGADICLSTSTASGKSAVFISVAADLLKRDPHARVLAFYPVRALVQDQLEKWKDALLPLGLTAGFIDGSVLISERLEILRRHRVVLMTPDVAHAWFMSMLSDDRIVHVRKNLQLLVLDEAHVYDGVFGTNMAYFLRRFQAVCRPARLICSTATLGKPDDFIFQLTGRRTVLFGPDQEGAFRPDKSVFVARLDAKKGFELSAQLLKKLAREHEGRFIAFADSRKMVELITAAAHRSEKESTANADQIIDDLADETTNQLVPYRAGYETEDRQRIQSALNTGQLRGVVSTSAFELGLDIGEIDLVILLTTPPSTKAFWQRIGRAGRKSRGECLVLDNAGVISSTEALDEYINRPIEPNWLYLPNRYIQYTNALCAAEEKQDAGDCYDQKQFSTLPESFNRFVNEELTPTQMLAADLFALKQRAQGAGVHYEFPLRSGVEPNYKIESQQRSLGDVNFSQLLREAFPGAVYYYMARPYRITQVNNRTREVTAHSEARYTTRPITQVMVFPDLSGGMHRFLRNTNGFVAETEMQVSERVLGFKEKRGPNETTNNYQVGSPYAQRPLQRLIRTTGVCWYFSDSSTISESIATVLLETFCREHAIQPRDLGIGRFHSRQSPLGTGAVQGICIFDATHGSLRLTERLGEQFERIVLLACDAAGVNKTDESETSFQSPLQSLLHMTKQLVQEHSGSHALQPGLVEISEWIEVVAVNEKAMLLNGTEGQEVTILSYFLSPQGLRYQLQHDTPTIRWTVEATAIQPIPGITKMLLYNQNTGEEKPN